MNYAYDTVQQAVTHVPLFHCDFPWHETDTYRWCKYRGVDSFSLSHFVYPLVDVYLGLLDYVEATKKPSKKTIPLDVQQMDKIVMERANLNDYQALLNHGYDKALIKFDECDFRGNKRTTYHFSVFVYPQTALIGVSPF